MTASRPRKSANAAARSYIGLALQQQNRPGDAAAAFREAAQLEPANLQFHNQAGNAAFAARDYVAAEASCREMTRLALHYQLKLPEAEAAFREAARLDPANGEHPWRLGHKDHWVIKQPGLAQ
jgi:tetratricopeptide (TPR) repeat protein